MRERERERERGRLFLLSTIKRSRSCVQRRILFTVIAHPGLDFDLIDSHGNLPPTSLVFNGRIHNIRVRTLYMNIVCMYTMHEHVQSI